jgi:salicylate hydroxylase
MRIVVCGAGIGGLTFAQALRDDADVIVIERDGRAEDTGGYRLSITAPAVAALARMVPKPALAEIRGASDPASAFRLFTVATDRLVPLARDSDGDADDRLLIQRRALRLLLTRGIEDRIRWSTQVREVDPTGDAPVVTLADGTRLEADLVVGAEGALSPTVRALTAAPASRDLRLAGIAGSTPRTAGAVVPAFLREGPALAFAGDGVGMFLSLTSRGGGTVADDVAAAIGPPSLVWGLIAPVQRTGPATARAPDELVQRALEITRRWHPWLRDRIAAADRSRVAVFPFRAADPRRDLTPWSSTTATALGDAIHAMPPTGGRAASTAILDADALAACLRAHLREGLPLDASLRHYQEAVPGWAVPAVRESLGPVRIIRALATPAGRAVGRPALALAAALSRLR